MLGGNALRKVPLVAFTCYTDPTPETVNSITTQFTLEHKGEMDSVVPAIVVSLVGALLLYYGIEWIGLFKRLYKQNFFTPNVLSILSDTDLVQR